MKTFIVSPFLLAVGLFIIAINSLKADEPRPTVYIWNFYTQDRQITTLTRSLTEEFETALGASRKFRILERRDIDLLHGQAPLEASINDTKKIPKDARDTLISNGADMVIFGEVFDDVGGGVYTIRVKLEKWSSDIIALKNENLPRDAILASLVTGRMLR